MEAGASVSGAGASRLFLDMEAAELSGTDGVLWTGEDKPFLPASQSFSFVSCSNSGSSPLFFSNVRNSQ